MTAGVDLPAIHTRRDVSECQSAFLSSGSASRLPGESQDPAMAMESPRVAVSLCVVRTSSWVFFVFFRPPSSSSWLLSLRHSGRFFVMPGVTRDPVMAANCHSFAPRLGRGCGRAASLIPAFAGGRGKGYAVLLICSGAERCHESAAFWIPHRVRDDRGVCGMTGGGCGMTEGRVG